MFYLSICGAATVVLILK